MRIALLSDVLSPDAGGGAERVVLELGRELGRRGVDVTIVLPTTPHTTQTLSTLRARGFEARTHPALLPVDVRRSLPDVWRLARFVRSLRADVVSLHTGCQWLRAKDLLAIALAHAPCVATIHGGEPFESEQQALRTRRAARLARRIVVHGSSVQRSLVAAGVRPGAIEHVNCGVPEPRARPSREASRARFGIGPDTFVVSTLARLIPRKGIADVLAAFARLPADADSVLLVGGDGPERAALESSLTGAARGRTHFLGALTDPSELYAASDLFVLPARHEAFGLVYVEAAQHGIPSIGASEDGTADAIQDGVTGVLVKPGDIPALAAAMARLHADTALRLRLGAAARRRAIDEFSVASMTDGYLRIFSAVAPALAPPAGASARLAVPGFLRKSTR